MANDTVLEVQKAATTENFTVTGTDGSAASDSYTSVVRSNGTNDTPVLNAVTGPTYTDTAADDTFVAATGTLTSKDRGARDRNPVAITGRTTGGSPMQDGATYHDSKVRTYGTLYMKSTTGD